MKYVEPARAIAPGLSTPFAAKAEDGLTDETYCRIELARNLLLLRLNHLLDLIVQFLYLALDRLRRSARLGCLALLPRFLPVFFFLQGVYGFLLQLYGLGLALHGLFQGIQTFGKILSERGCSEKTRGGNQAQETG